MNLEVGTYMFYYSSTPWYERLRGGTGSITGKEETQPVVVM